MAQEIKTTSSQQDFMPLLPLRDVVVYPHLVIPLFVGRVKSVKALEIASDKDKKIILVAQKSASKDEPDAKDLYEYGTVASILQMLKLPDGTVKVLVEGLNRVKIKEVIDQEACFVARFEELNIPEPNDKESLALMRTVFSQFDQYVKLNKKIPPEILTSLAAITDPGRLADMIAAHLTLKLEEKQTILETLKIKNRLDHLLKIMESEIDILQVEKRIRAEASVVRNYIDTLIGLPWQKKTKISRELALAEKILDEDHYGLEKVKERIIEYLAVQQRVDKLKAPILCLVGPPGVGKTSLGQSIAKAVNRKFIRMALGGVRDESEIRGHRRTYIGSMPGKVLQSMSKVGVTNPLFLLDEVDKMGQDYRGDPASALLEVLDPEQNHTFTDHYVEVEYDLSDVMFVATANSMNIPEPLLDRMEIIRLSGYTEAEKLNIAMQYLLPKQLKMHGLKKSEISITPKVVREIIQFYSREAGVRKLEQEIAKICRKAVKELLSKKSLKKVIVNSKNLESYLGVKVFDIGLASKKNQIGQVTGLAWTQVGGELLTIEAVVLPGKGKTIITGKLGDVMQESIHAAMSVVRSRAKKLGIAENFYEKNDIHIHLPEGATPKDGPSAGIGITSAIVSALTNISVRADVAMTGEITLRGEVLPIGGLKEKLLAAHRGGIKTVLIPEQNVKDLTEISDEVKNTLEIHPVRWIDEVLELTLTKMPKSAAAKDQKSVPVPHKKLPNIIKSITH